MDEKLVLANNLSAFQFQSQQSLKLADDQTKIQVLENKLHQRE